MKALKAGLIMGVLLIGSIATAQENAHKHKSPEERTKIRTERLAEELSLTDEQKTKVETMMAEAAKKRQEIMANASLTEEQKKAELKTNRENAKTQMKSILTPEQQTKLEIKKAEMKAHREEHANRTPEEKAQFRTDRMAKELTLTEEQKTKVRVLELKTIQKAESIRKDQSLTDEQKKAALKESRQAHGSELNTILTNEQRVAHKQKHAKFGKRDGHHCKAQQDAPKK